MFVIEIKLNTAYEKTKIVNTLQNLKRLDTIKNTKVIVALQHTLN